MRDWGRWGLVQQWRSVGLTHHVLERSQFYSNTWDSGAEAEVSGGLVMAGWVRGQSQGWEALWSSPKDALHLQSSHPQPWPAVFRQYRCSCGSLTEQDNLEILQWMKRLRVRALVTALGYSSGEKPYFWNGFQLGPFQPKSITFNYLPGARGIHHALINSTKMQIVSSFVISTVCSWHSCHEARLEICWLADMLISHENSFPKWIWSWNEHGFFSHLRQWEPEFLITCNYLYSYLGHFIYPQGGVNWWEFKYEVRSEQFKHFTCWVLGGGWGRMGVVFLFNCLYVWADWDVLCCFIFTLEVWIILISSSPISALKLFLESAILKCCG